MNQQENYRQGHYPHPDANLFAVHVPPELSSGLSAKIMQSLLPYIDAIEKEKTPKTYNDALECYEAALPVFEAIEASPFVIKSTQKTIAQLKAKLESFTKKKDPQ